MSNSSDTRSPKGQMKLAILIDAENVSSQVIQGLFDEIAKLGTANVRRIYGDWTNPNVAPWKQTLHMYALEPVQQFSYTSGKSSTDSALIIDAMDILHERRVDGFCIVSSDSDYTRLATRIREPGLIVYGFGEEKTPEAFRQACDKFIYIENLRKTSVEVIEIEPIKVQAQASLSESTNVVAKKLSDDELRILIKNAVEDASDETGWAFLGDVGNIIRNKAPDFDPRTYGYPKLTSVVNSLNLFEIQSRKTIDPSAQLIYLRPKLKTSK